eukprot:scaffold2716_cov179-Amphora_coffeaeformis.AAC.22
MHVLHHLQLLSPRYFRSGFCPLLVTLPYLYYRIQPCCNPSTWKPSVKGGTHPSLRVKSVCPYLRLRSQFIYRSSNANDCLSNRSVEEKHERIHSNKHTTTACKNCVDRRSIQCPTPYCRVDTTRYENGQGRVHIDGGDKVIVGRLECSQASLRLDIKYANRLIIRRRNDVLSRWMQNDGPDPIFVRIKDSHTRGRSQAPQTHRPITGT